MDRPRSQRDMVFCHECENDWFRDEHGLTCPQCGSDFTEIIEEDHDPRDDYADGLRTMPGLGPFDPSNVPDPDEEDINRVHFSQRQTGYSMPGSFSNVSPVQNNASGGNTGGGQDQHGAANERMDPGRTTVANNFASMLAGILGITAQQPSQTTVFPGGQTTTRTYSLGNSRITFSSASFSGRFPPPGDPPHPHPGALPGQEMHNVLSPLFAGLEGPFAVRGMGGPGMPINPLSSLLNIIFNPAAAQHGDVVYTQEALDRVISQLMEQNNMGNAPGPASAEEIASLPKKQVDKSMLDDNGKGECSICMDEVHIGDEVTQLYCTHWFHGPCVSMWLNEHDTCPHCRKGIRQSKEENQARANASGNSETARREPGSRRTSSFSIHRTSSNADGGSSSSTGGGGGFTDRVRNFFGRN